MREVKVLVLLLILLTMAFSCQRRAFIDLNNNQKESIVSAEDSLKRNCEDLLYALREESDVQVGWNNSIHKDKVLAMFYYYRGYQLFECPKKWEIRYGCFEGMTFAHFDSFYLRGVDSGYYKRRIEELKGTIGVGAFLLCGDMGSIYFVDYVATSSPY